MPELFRRDHEWKTYFIRITTIDSLYEWDILDTRENVLASWWKQFQSEEICKANAEDRFKLLPVTVIVQWSMPDLSDFG